MTTTAEFSRFNDDLSETTAVVGGRDDRRLGQVRVRAGARPEIRRSSRGTGFAHIQIPPTEASGTPRSILSWNQGCEGVESGDNLPLSSDIQSGALSPRCFHAGAARLRIYLRQRETRDRMLSKTDKPRTQAAEMRTTEHQDDSIARADIAAKAPDYLRIERNAASAAPNIFITCPTTGIPVTTGLTTRWVVFDSLPAVAVPLCCPACGQVHNWKPQDAWICHAGPDLTLISTS